MLTEVRHVYKKINSKELLPSTILQGPRHVEMSRNIYMYFFLHIQHENTLHSFQEMKQQYEIQHLSLDEQRSRMQQQLDTFREELTAKLNIANQEVRKHTLFSS